MGKIKTANKGDLVELDGEWVELIIEAKNMGMKLEDVLAFFEKRMKDGTQETVNDRT
ncbi:anti-repressor SinI family protein [Bacillus sp. 1P02SD]|uniref:anti-repressor SinI family protein n=1 Tax=Bacillus sp. 1P02SD TaxID=3132264 RepID=UPI0039A2F4CB